jgi:uncharacterized protein YbgA (DUF1722 family)/uncharacterized protein YbbK (DUF523 family)
VSGRAARDPRPDPLWRDDAPIRVGISTCLLGREVRWDGGHKRDRFLTDVLGGYVEWVPVCPEVELGMGTPREPVRLVRAEGEVRMVGTKTGRDWTRGMRELAARRVRELARLELCGYVLKKDSPSCGMERVRVYAGSGPAARDGVGLFAEALLDANEALPVEEEGRLHDPVLRDSFIERLFAYRRLRSLFDGRLALRRLVAFHTAHKLQLLAHSPRAYAELGRLVAGAKRLAPASLHERYERDFMGALAHRATPRRHVNVLQHCLGHFRDRVDAGARAEILGVVEDYGRGLVPLVVPITLVHHYARRLGIDYLLGQVYLEPHPKELMLRNHV